MLRRQQGHVREREIHDFIGYLDGSWRTEQPPRKSQSHGGSPQVRLARAALE